MKDRARVLARRQLNLFRTRSARFTLGSARSMWQSCFLYHRTRVNSSLTSQQHAEQPGSIIFVFWGKAAELSSPRPSAAGQKSCRDQQATSAPVAPAERSSRAPGAECAQPPGGRPREEQHGLDRPQLPPHERRQHRAQELLAVSTRDERKKNVKRSKETPRSHSKTLITT